MSHYERVEFLEMTIQTGPGAGALVVWYTRKGASVRVKSKGSGDWKWYADTIEKMQNGQKVYVAVFPRIPEGTYDVYNPVGSDRTVSVFGGHIAEVDLR